MMVAALIADLEAAGARLAIRDGLLVATGPRALFTPATRAAIEANRADLMAALTSDAEPTAAPESPAVRVNGAGVLATGLDNAARHRVLWAIAGHHWTPVRNVAARHDYHGGAIAFAADNDAVAARVARLARHALEPPESAESTNGATPCALK